MITTLPGYFQKDFPGCDNEAAQPGNDAYLGRHRSLKQREQISIGRLTEYNGRRPDTPLLPPPFCCESSCLKPILNCRKKSPASSFLPSISISIRMTFSLMPPSTARDLDWIPSISWKWHW